MDVQTLASKLVSFKSTHENVVELQACLDFCTDYFSDLKSVIKKYECNGIKSVVISNSDTLTPEVMLLGHIDTVEGDESLFNPRIEDSRLYGRGTLDMKAFVATSMKVIESVIKENISKSVALAIVTDEELGGTHGARYLVEEIGYRPKVVLVPDDGEDLNVIVSETKHIYKVKFTAKGLESHANRPWDGDNAILKLFETYQNLERLLNVPKDRPEDIFIDTCNLGVLSGGVASNEVPENAEMLVDVRIVTMSKQEVVGILSKSLVEGVTFEIIMEGYPTKLDRESELVKKYITAIQKHTDKPIEYKRAGGATDARYFAAVGVVPIVHQSHGRNAQARDEYVDIEELEKLVEVQTDFIKSL